MFSIELAEEMLQTNRIIYKKEIALHMEEKAKIVRIIMSTHICTRAHANNIPIFTKLWCVYCFQTLFNLPRIYLKLFAPFPSLIFSASQQSTITTKGFYRRLNL